MPLGWQARLNGDPLPWLLGDDVPAVKHLALRQLLDRPKGDPEVQPVQTLAMQVEPIASIMAAQNPRGYWVKPGAGYGPKYLGTIWQLVFLDQLGADPQNPRVHAACEYVLSHAQTESGGFGCSSKATESAPPPSMVIHCLHGNLLRALLGLGLTEDERVQQAIDWQARSITGEGFPRYYQSATTGPGFCCAANRKLPCAWGAIKAMLALARVPDELRTPLVQRAIQVGADFLLSRDPAAADYPSDTGRPNGSWFKLGFPLGYVTDVLQNLEALCELGLAKDSLLQPAVDWLLSKQDGHGRWKNEYAYNGKTWVDFEKQGQTSKWVTLRACRVLKMVFG